MKTRLLELSESALQSMNRRDFESATRALNELLTLQPDWEHGGGAYDLACCLEELGSYAEAEQMFAQALNYEPDNPIYLGGLASFLFLHGDPHKALEKHLILLKLEKSLHNEAKVTSIAQAIRSLGQRIGLNTTEVECLLDESRQ
jgi:Flp pilus assembly protein TadD